MRERSLQIVKEHWGQVLSCSPVEVLSSGVTVTAWDRPSVELLTWDGGAVVGAPEPLTAPLREQIRTVPFDLNRDDAREIVEEDVGVGEVLGPQFVGYCDEETFTPAEGEVELVEAEELIPLRDACPESEWVRSGVQIDDKDDQTFAVLRDGQPIAASQLGCVHGVAGVATIVRPAYRGQGYGKSVVSRAVESALQRDLLPEYRTLERWQSSVNLASDLGFERCARSLLMKVSEPP